ncbi:MAG: 7-carboxy-7-deazaguanine synthase QueE [Candidatus Hodarchaeales archaeon]
MRVSEIFYSFQGEGIYCGQSSVFIRFFGCNLRCIYCDTLYSYEDSQECKNLSPNEIVDEILTHGCRYVVVTGGEPLLQVDLDKLMLELKNNLDTKITIETNCTIFKENLLELVDFWSISPKLKGSNQYYNEEVLNSYLDNARDFQLKFVILDRGDLDQVKEMLEKQQHKLTPKLVPIIFQPNGRLPNKKYLEAWGNLVEMVKKDEFFNQFDTRVIPQLHRMLYGNRRGI